MRSRPKDTELVAGGAWIQSQVCGTPVRHPRRLHLPHIGGLRLLRCILLMRILIFKVVVKYTYKIKVGSLTIRGHDSVR